MKDANDELLLGRLKYSKEQQTRKPTEYENKFKKDRVSTRKLSESRFRQQARKQGFGEPVTEQKSLFEA